MKYLGMIDVDYDQAHKDLIYLCRCAVNEIIPNEAVIATLDLDAVFAAASAHMVAAAVAMALQSAGCMDGRINEVIASAQRKAVIFEHALAGVKADFEAAGIWYMLLKGAVLKDMYPKFGMREFADYDILVDAARTEDVKDIMEGLGFTTEAYERSNQDIYYKRPMLNFEIHRTLFVPDRDGELYSYFLNVQDRLVCDGLEKFFKPDDFYLYFLAHEYMHYSGGGTGLRSLMDTYVFLRSAELDMTYVAAEAEKLGLREFEVKNRSLALHLFGDGELADEDTEMLEYILSSGAYGSFVHQVLNDIHKGGVSRLKYMLKRFAVPFSEKNKNYEKFAEQYPLFYEHKVLLPLLPFYRINRSMKEGRFFAEAKAIRDSGVSAFPK